MSEENIQKTPEEKREQDGKSIELTINKATNEIIFRDSTGEIYIVQPKVIEPEIEDEPDREPLTVDEFRFALEKLDALGITWTTDIPPHPVFKKGIKRSKSFRDEYHQLQKKYPQFPHELGAVIFNALLGSKQSPLIVGSEETLKEKAALINQVLLTQEYRSEYFFKFAIKVPYFEEIDWEVVIKAYERGTRNMPKIAYSLLSLSLRDPIDTTLSLEEGANESRDVKFITVAVNEHLIDRLIGRLTDAKNALEKAQRAVLSEQNALEEEYADESDSPRHLE